jgi:erythronate-4-phosphate dehydrogenase
MNIFYDENMPFAAEFFADLGVLTPFSGRTLSPMDIQDADVLLVRSITKVNESLLLQNQALSFVGTATIGVDHIDQAYLATRQINFHSAPGCNAISVAEYVLSAMVVLAEHCRCG